MNPLRPIGLVMVRELRERGLSRSYLISWVILVFLIGAGFTVPTLLGDDGEERVYRLGAVGPGSSDTVDRARTLAAGVRPPVRMETAPFTDRAAAAQAVGSEDYDAALVDGEELIVAGSGGSLLESLLQEAARSLLVERMVASGEVSDEAVALLSGQVLEVTGPAPADDPDDEARRYLIGQAALVLLFMATMMTGSWVLLGVTEEKTSRVVEVLLSAVRPWQLLAGKIVGVGILGLIQFSVLVGGIVTGIRLGFGPGAIPEVDAGLLATLLVWFVLGYAVYAVGYAAVGAVASRPEDAQNAAFPMTMISLIGYLTGIFYVSANPDSTLSVALSFVPPAAPFVVPVRAVSDVVGPWELAAAAAVTVGFAIWLTRVAGRIYSGGVFKHRSRVKITEAFRSADF